MRVILALGRGPGTEATKANARAAAQLWLADQRNGRPSIIVMSGRCSFTDDDPGVYSTEAAQMKTEALLMDVPEASIIIDDWARDTVSNMVGSLRALRRHEPPIVTTELVLVVLPHTGPRARYAASKVYHRLRGRFFRRFSLISVVESDYLFPGPGEEARIQREERRHYWVTRLLLAFVRPGNIRDIQWRFKLIHPGYRTWRRKTKRPINLLVRP